MADTHAENSPCDLSMADLTNCLGDFLSKDEYIKEWELDPNGKNLTIWIYKKEQSP